MSHSSDSYNQFILELQRVLVITNLAKPIAPPPDSEIWNFASVPSAPVQGPKILNDVPLSKMIDHLTKIVTGFKKIGAIVSIIRQLPEVPPTSFSKTAFPYMVAMKISPTFESSPVRVAHSNVHGRGVFATRNLKPNELVTTYPVDALRVQADMAPKEDAFVYLYKDNNMYSNSTNYASVHWEAYKVQVAEKHQAVCIFGNPDVHYPGACGHLINDAKNSGKRRNCAMCTLLGGVVTAILVLHPIKEGEELLMSYGDGYWNDQHHN